MSQDFNQTFCIECQEPHSYFDCLFVKCKKCGEKGHYAGKCPNRGVTTNFSQANTKNQVQPKSEILSRPASADNIENNAGVLTSLQTTTVVAKQLKPIEMCKRSRKSDETESEVNVKVNKNKSNQNNQAFVKLPSDLPTGFEKGSGVIEPLNSGIEPLDSGTEPSNSGFGFIQREDDNEKPSNTKIYSTPPRSAVKKRKLNIEAIVEEEKNDKKLQAFKSFDSRPNKVGRVRSKFEFQFGHSS
jgi:hypothetical protein